MLSWMVRLLVALDEHGSREDVIVWLFVLALLALAALCVAVYLVGGLFT